MALDFYDINDIHLGRKLFEVGYVDFEVLGPILSSFKRVTGIAIDPYGTTRIYAAHIRLIMSLIQEYLLKSKELKPKEDEILNFVLAHFEQVQEGFIIIGD
jgi:hypothetical protein